MNHYTLKLLIIEHNPLLDDGRRASELVNMTDKIHPAVEELMDDIRHSSHGLVNCKIVGWETVDEFPRHTCTFKLDSGESNTLDSATVKKLFENGWYGWWNNDWFNKTVCPEDVGFTYDYAHMMEKHDIVNRRNKGEFDMVLLVNIDPVYTFEACMIGRNAYWINGEPIEADCPMTAVMNVSVSRRDANFECFGHMMEMIMGHVFCDSTEESGYCEGEYNGIPVEKMNLWNRFVLCDRNYKDGPSGCGNVHFSPNSVCDYDWKNTTVVLSTWRDWLDNYPNLTGEAEPTDCYAYIPRGIGEKDACRLHHRWWFSCMPHVAGVTEDGYSHSWWDYFSELDYVASVTAPETLTVKSGEEIAPVFTLTYRSGKTREVKPFDADVFTEMTGNAIRCADCGTIRACGHGSAEITVKRDGKTGRMTIKIN